MDEFCRVCERVAFGDVVRLGFDHWRHAHCELGSPEWDLYYQRQAKAVRAKLTEFHNYVYEGKT